MADSFFELKNPYPEHDDECDGLEEEEYDALNDETFGSDAFIPEEDWEDTHNLLSAVTESNRSRNDDEDDDDIDVENLIGRLGLDDEVPDFSALRNHRYDFDNRRVEASGKPLDRSPPMPLHPPRFSKVPTVAELERELLEGGKKRQGQSYSTPPPPVTSNNNIKSNVPRGFPSPLSGLLPMPRIPAVFPPPPTSSGFPPGLVPSSQNKPPGFFPPGLDLQGRGKGPPLPSNRGPPPLQGKQMGMFPTPPPHLPPEMMMMRSPQDKLALRLLYPPPLGYPMVPQHPNILRFLPPARNIYPPMFPQMRHDGYVRNNFPPHPFLQQHQMAQKQLMQHLNRQRQLHHQSNRRNSENDDEYAKLMNNRERTWLLNIQIMQLATDKPHIDDYYYTMWKKKHPQPKLRNGFHKDDQRKKQAPFFANNRNDNNSRERKDSEGNAAASPRVYVPLQFENSLGKLQCGSVTAPRMIIDMDVVSEPQNGPQPPQVQKDQRKTKKILLEVERLYVLVIEAEEIEETPDVDHEVSADELVTKALIGFLNEERFLSFLCIRKGKTLLLRCLNLLEDLQLPLLTDLWSRLLKGFPTIVRRDRDDLLLPKLYPYFKAWTSIASWSNLLSVARSLLSNARDGRTSVMRASPAPSKPLLSYILANQFGVSVVSRLVVQGELAAALLSESETVHWKTFIEELVKNLSSLDSVDTVAKPIDPIPHNILTATLNNRCTNLSTHLHVTAKKILAS